MEGSSIAFIVICTGLVFLMTPALAFFYGGLERRKNVISTMMMSVVSLALATVMWFAVGYSLSFSGDGNLIGDLGHAFFQGVSDSESTRGLTIPDSLFAVFQMMFSIITVGILTGSVAGRMRFKPLLIFIVGWLLLVYYPFAHMVWDEGLLAQWGTIDFAGGDVVHITSGVSGLVLALVVGKRKDFNRLEYRPHNVPFVLLGAGLLWFGWFGFNAGSALAADGLAVHALVTTHLSAAAAMFSWILLEYLKNGKPSLVGASTGLVAGLVAITPGAGFVSTWSAVIIGLLVSPVCFYAIAIVKHKLGYDDALDAFGCHGVGGIFGGIVTGLFTTPELALDPDNIGLIYGNPRLFLVTIAAIVFTIVWSAGMTFVLIKGISFFMPLRVSDREEAIGLDNTEHGETAYPTFMGLDS
ncbi:TPA: ammonium transporter [Streptococcus suis]|uniref:Ammonium transporter n=1 Tax=Streptococcus suis TaxID=1307 RepID=A0A9X4MKY2_STRSU|nr:ammonium transporter [Streptococcus parasuis]MDG4512609.1 ammonium transporter [Streptococcus suis]QWV87622.1 ammonium transporter [Streptococcus parasuis]HEM3597752.1 ammonium transporter [Streptococcus suis]HEM3607758.1 ammonium transporter [Streptococcus suis]HEM3610326.1 ammonium transporter [Streptococcus suis]